MFADPDTTSAFYGQLRRIVSTLPTMSERTPNANGGGLGASLTGYDRANRSSVLRAFIRRLRLRPLLTRMFKYL